MLTEVDWRKVLDLVVFNEICIAKHSLFHGCVGFLKTIEGVFETNFNLAAGMLNGGGVIWTCYNGLVIWETCVSHSQTLMGAGLAGRPPCLPHSQVLMSPGSGVFVWFSTLSRP